MTSTRTTFPDLVMGRSDPSWGDERERSVLLDGYAYTYVLSAVTLWVVGAVIAWFIPGWVTLVLFLAILVPALEFSRYCSSRGVDAQRLTWARSTRSRLVVVSVISGVSAASMMCAAMADLTPAAGRTAMLIACAIGGLIGGVAAFVISRVRARRAEAREPLTADDEF